MLTSCLLLVWVPRKFTLEEGGYVTVQHQDSRRDPVPRPGGQARDRVAEWRPAGQGRPCPVAVLLPISWVLRGHCHVTSAKASQETSWLAT